MKSIFLTRLGTHNGYRRLWIEDAYGRLTATGFSAGTPIEVKPRQSGAGLMVSTTFLSSLSVSRRGSTPLLSVEGRSLDCRYLGDDARVRATHGSLCVAPRAFALRFEGLTTDAEIVRTRLFVNGTTFPLRGRSPLRLETRISTLRVECINCPVFWVAEFISNHRPGRILFSAEAPGVLARWLLSAGYHQLSEVEFHHTSSRL